MTISPDVSAQGAAAAPGFKHLPKVRKAYLWGAEVAGRPNQAVTDGIMQVQRAAHDAHVQRLLQKWGMLSNMQCLTFQYSNKYHHMQAAEFLTDFFNDANVREAFQVVTGDATWAPITGQVTSIDSAVVSANATSMDMFDRLKDAPEPILRSGTWDIVKCFQDERDGFIIQDRLRELILAAEDSENDGLVAEADQQQFLWLIFEHLVLGGSMNQFEDSAEVYVDLAKRLYKDLVTPQKNCATGEIEVRSAVYKATSMETDGGTKLFPVGNRNSFCYVTTDPSRSVCKCFYHAFVPHW